jgi:hypothetical protein
VRGGGEMCLGFSLHSHQPFRRAIFGSKSGKASGIHMCRDDKGDMRSGVMAWCLESGRVRCVSGVKCQDEGCVGLCQQSKPPGYGA